MRASHGATLNSPQPASTVSVGLPLSPYSPPWDFKQPGLSWCCSSFVCQGRELLTQLSPGSPAAGLACVGWGCSSCGPHAGLRDLFFLKQPPHRLFFQCPLYFLVSYLHKRLGTVVCSFCSSVNRLGVSPVCKGKWTPLPPISQPSSLFFQISFQFLALPLLLLASL